MTRDEAEQYLYYAMTIGEQLLCCVSAWLMVLPGRMFFPLLPVL